MEIKIPKINWDNEVIGETTISEAMANDWPRRISRVYVFNQSGDMLVQLRSKNAKSFPGLWDQSAGGHVDVGETELQAAERELKEELGISAELELIAEGVRSDRPDDKVFSYMYRCNIVDDVELNPDPEEVTDTRWLSVEDFEKEIATYPDKFVPTFLYLYKTYRDKLIP